MGVCWALSRLGWVLGAAPRADTTMNGEHALCKRYPGVCEVCLRHRTIVHYMACAYAGQI